MDRDKFNVFAMHDYEGAWIVGGAATKQAAEKLAKDYVKANSSAYEAWVVVVISHHD